MSLRNALQLLLLASLWGGSFLFMKIAANSLGPAVLIEARVLSAALFLLIVSIFIKRKLLLLKHKKHFFILGLFNTALPFLFFAYAAQTLNASTLSILNSTSAIWGAVISVFWTKTALTKNAVLGLMLGVIGVTVLVGWNGEHLGMDATLPIIAAISASACYGIASNYSRTVRQITSFDNAHGSMWAAVLIVLPLVFFIPIRETPTLDISLSVAALGVLCTGVAYLLYFNLVANIGAASALSVTFLIPAFGLFWGYVVLDEQVGWNTLFGTILVLSGTTLVTGFSFRALIDNRKAR
ncbi:DMT family transporter [Vibrio sp. MA40-2]|uniref:DMT family transporter n=1 Tax=Vibrio sp. MA40-2 TaxID=3391828 RepID=UPI0039A5B6A3